MGLNKSTGNMYDFITHTWNTVKGECYHDCSYCYMKRWGHLKPVRLDEKEFKTDLGKDNFIFVGSSCDMWADNIPKEWIEKTLRYCAVFDNKYLFQTKNPKNIKKILSQDDIVCLTLETNRYYTKIMKNSPSPRERVNQMKFIKQPVYITIEPIMDFDLLEFVSMLKACNPVQINLGADTNRHNLPEPTKNKLLDLIYEIEKFTIIHKKSNLKWMLR